MSETPVQPNRKALALISGGLDSALAVRLVLEQGIEVVAVHFVNPFDDPAAAESGRARRTADRLGVSFHAEKKGQDFVEVLRHPRHGFGSGVNPCIDCRIWVFTRARQLLQEFGASFLISGEVLGQRPMSQQRYQLNLISKSAGVEGLLLRPLSAKRFEPTLPELDGRIDRQRLEGISGRSRARQLELARAFGLEGITSGAGGCLLTDANYAKKVRDLYAHQPEIVPEDYRLLATGRHLRLDPETRLIMGRNVEESERLGGFLAPGRTLLEPHNFSGPTLLLDGPLNPPNVERALTVLAAYSKPKEGEDPDAFEVLVKRHDGAEDLLPFVWRPVDRAETAKWSVL